MYTLRGRRNAEGRGRKICVDDIDRGRPTARRGGGRTAGGVVPPLLPPPAHLLPARRRPVRAEGDTSLCLPLRLTFARVCSFFGAARTRTRVRTNKGYLTATVICRETKTRRSVSALKCPTVFRRTCPFIVPFPRY